MEIAPVSALLGSMLSQRTRQVTTEGDKQRQLSMTGAAASQTRPIDEVLRRKANDEARLIGRARRAATSPFEQIEEQVFSVTSSTSSTLLGKRQGRRDGRGSEGSEKQQHERDEKEGARSLPCLELDEDQIL